MKVSLGRPSVSKKTIGMCLSKFCTKQIEIHKEGWSRVKNSTLDSLENVSEMVENDFLQITVIAEGSNWKYTKIDRNASVLWKGKWVDGIFGFQCWL